MFLVGVRGVRDLALVQSVQAGPWAPSSLYPIDIRGPFSGSKAAEA